MLSNDTPSSPQLHFLADDERQTTAVFTSHDITYVEGARKKVKLENLHASLDHPLKTCSTLRKGASKVPEGREQLSAPDGQTRSDIGEDSIDKFHFTTVPEEVWSKLLSQLLLSLETGNAHTSMGSAIFATCAVFPLGWGIPISVGLRKDASMWTQFR